MLNNVTDKILPWGTPISCWCISERVEPTRTLNSLSERKLEIKEGRRTDLQIDTRVCARSYKVCTNRENGLTSILYIVRAEMNTVTYKCEFGAGQGPSAHCKHVTVLYASHRFLQDGIFLSDLSWTRSDHFRNVCLNYNGSIKMTVRHLIPPVNIPALNEDHQNTSQTMEEHFLEKDNCQRRG
ncbi:hypothetical protein ACJMK2_013575 [Sinanodonta woodiana]|uniref:SWIM-type domain-containing protein n=1 Tax=Sinanodonta woodiana TaxID=1069815 RepID=A0ABD3UXX4_SINWO